MTGRVTAAAVRVRCSRNVKENIEKADGMVREAAARGAGIILLPELFERRISARNGGSYYGYAKPVMENDAVIHFPSDGA